YAVAGVMPPGRGYPADADLWRPITAEERDDGDRELTMVARLQAGVSASQASAALATLADNATKGSATAWAEDIQTNGVRDVQTALSVLFAAAVLVLIVVCANVAALLGGSSGDRVAEMALRRALGATRARLAGQLLIENLVLAVAGGGLGLLLGRWTLNAIVAIAPAGLPRLSEIALDRRIIVVGLVAIVVVGVAAGLGPALQASRRADLIHEGARATRRVRGRRMLVLAQVAVAVVLTAGARSLAGHPP